MHLIEILLPLYGDRGSQHGRELFEAVARELTERFGGLTAHTRAPAKGLWKDDAAHTTRDDIVIYEVMAPQIDDLWWRQYRQSLEQRFRQEQVIIRAFTVHLL